MHWFTPLVWGQAGLMRRPIYGLIRLWEDGEGFVSNWIDGGRGNSPEFSIHFKDMIIRPSIIDV